MEMKVTLEEGCAQLGRAHHGAELGIFALLTCLMMISLHLQRVQECCTLCTFSQLNEIIL